MLRVAVAQLRPRKGAYRENLAQLGAAFRQLADGPAVPDLVVCPETALTGYFLEGGVRDLALSAEQLFADLAEQHAAAGAPPWDIALGFYEEWRNRFYNSSLYATLGGPEAGVRHVHRKVFLPTYGVFDEERFVEAGREVAAFDTGWGRAAMLVCEDAWHSLMPTLAALDGAQLIIIPSATPARGIEPMAGNGAAAAGEAAPTNLGRWDRLAGDSAAEHGVYVVIAQLVGFEGGKAFAGGSIVAGPRGDILARGPLFEPGLVSVDLDFAEITRARAELPLLADLEMRLPHLLQNFKTALPNGTGAGRAANKPPARPAGLPPLRLRAADQPLAIDPELTRRWLVEFIRDEVVRRRGFDRAVLGLSGGVDSAVVAYLAAEALGPEHVTMVRMPYRTSSPDSLAHAQLVIDALGLPARTVDISAAVDGLETAIGGEMSAARRGNVMARARMITLFDLSAALNALPLGTGNKSERLLGYFTWHADDSPPVNPIGDLFKSQVWTLARHLGVPDVIVDKPASADLVQGQTDEADFGVSYATIDLILHWLLSGYGPEEIAAAGLPLEEINLVRGRLESTHWKRRLPTVAMLSHTAIGEYYLRPVDF